MDEEEQRRSASCPIGVSTFSGEQGDCERIGSERICGEFGGLEPEDVNRFGMLVTTFTGMLRLTCLVEPFMWLLQRM